MILEDILLFLKLYSIKNYLKNQYFSKKKKSTSV